MNWVAQNGMKRLWCGDVVGETSDWSLMSSHVIVFPLSKKSYDEIASEFSSQDLGEEIDVANESSLKDNWNVRGVEKLDWVWLLEASHFLAAQRKLNSEALEVNDNECDNDCGEQVAKVWSILSVNGLLNTIELIWLGQQEMEQGDDSSLELCSLVGSNCHWGEGFPQDGLADVGGDEE